MSNRSIFEEVGSDQKQNAPGPVAIERGDMNARGFVVRWLFVLFVLLVVMIVVGGLTRLTDSGLSITEWAPIKGMLPPLSAAAWDAEFLKYQAIPEFSIVNSAMSLAEFKVIYWWEWGHRFLGRVIGLVWAAGFAWIALRRMMPRGWLIRLLVLGLLGGLQGVIGWWMVSSGLEGERVDVASYRLATHLGLAFGILGLIIWYIFCLKRPEMELFQARRRREAGLMPIANILTGLVFLQILLGALVAGLDAGRTYIDWPLMAGGIFPPDMFGLSPWWSNFFENEGLTQFNHRLLAYILLGFAVFAFLRARRSALKAIRSNFGFALGFIAAQAVMGIVTVLYAAPLNLAIMHQLMAVLVWIIVLRARFEVVYPSAQSVRG